VPCHSPAHVMPHCLCRRPYIYTVPLKGRSLGPSPTRALYCPFATPACLAFTTAQQPCTGLLPQPSSASNPTPPTNSLDSISDMVHLVILNILPSHLSPALIPHHAFCHTHAKPRTHSTVDPLPAGMTNAIYLQFLCLSCTTPTTPAVRISATVHLHHAD